MNWWDQISDFGKGAEAALNINKLNKGANAALSGIGAGIQNAALNNPYIGKPIQDVGHSINIIKDTIAPPSNEQLTKRIQDDYTKRQAEEGIRQAKNITRSDKTGKSYNAVDILKNQVPEIAATVAGAGNLLAYGAAKANPFEWRNEKAQKANDLAYNTINNSIDDLKRQGKNITSLGLKEDSFGNRKKYYDSLSDSIKKHITPEQKQLLLSGQGDISQIKREATNANEVSILTASLKNKVKNGDITAQKAQEILNQQQSQFQVRDTAGQILTDPTITPGDYGNLAKAAVSLPGAMVKGTIDTGKAILGAPGKVFKSAQKLLPKAPEVAPIGKGILNKAKSVLPNTEMKDVKYKNSFRPLNEDNLVGSPEPVVAPKSFDEAYNSVVPQETTPHVTPQETPQVSQLPDGVHDLHTDPIIESGANPYTGQFEHLSQSGKLISNDDYLVARDYQNQFKNVNTPPLEQPQVPSVENPTGVIPDAAPSISDNLVAQTSESINNTKILDPKDHGQILKEITENPHLTPEHKAQLLDDFHAKVKESILNPTPQKVNQSVAKDEVDELKRLIPDATNDEISTKLLDDKVKELKQIGDTRANKIFEKMSADAASVGDVLDPTDLTKVWQPPQFKIGKNGTKVFDPSIPKKSIQVEYRNPLQKVFHDIALPYSKQSGLAIGMDPTKYLDKTKQITESLVKPLTELVFGSYNEVNYTKIKKVLGQIAHGMDEASIKIQDGQVLHADNVPAFDYLDTLLKNSDQSIQKEKTISNLLKKSDEIKGLTVDEAFQKIGDLYNTVTENLKDLGLPEDLAKRAAVYHGKSYTFDGGDVGAFNTYDKKVGVNAGQGVSSALTMEQEIAARLHEDVHKWFNYTKVRENPKMLKLLEESVKEGLNTSGKKDYNSILHEIKQVDPDVLKENMLNETVAYYIQAVEEFSKGIAPQNSVISRFHNIVWKAQNGDQGAIKLLDNLEGLKKGLQKNAHEYEQDLVNELQNTILPDGRNAFEAMISTDLTKPNVTAEFNHKFNSMVNKSKITNTDEYLADVESRMNRMKELMSENGSNPDLVYRGAERQPSTGKVRPNYGSFDQLYTPGVYTSTNPSQAADYLGAGVGDNIMEGTPSRILKKDWNPSFTQNYSGLERPLFWDEKVPADIIHTLKKDKKLKGSIESLGGEEVIKNMNMEDFVLDIKESLFDKGFTHAGKEGSNFDKETAGIGKKLVDDLYKKAGYDGFIGPSTDQRHPGYEVVHFDSHTMMERTDEMRKADLAAKQPKLARNNSMRMPMPVDLEGKAPTVDELEMLKQGIMNTNTNNVRRIGYNIK